MAKGFTLALLFRPQFDGVAPRRAAALTIITQI